MTDALDYTVGNGYIQLGLTTDPNELQQNALVAIGQELPGWVPREGHIEVLLLEQFAAMAAESAQVAANVPLAIFSYFGTLIGITPTQGAYASAQTTWTMVDNKGYTVPAGTIVGYQVLGNQLYQFATVTTFTIPPGSNQTNPGAVLIQSVAVGQAFNGLAAQALTLVTSFSFVAGIQSTSVSSGGADQETTTAYLNRLSNELKLLAPRPILPADFAALAQSVSGVYRAAAFNGLDPYSNILVDQDSEYSTGLGTWTATQDCVLEIGTGSYGEFTITMTGSGAGTNAIASTATYPISQLQNYVALVELDESSAAKTGEVGVNVYNVAGTLLGTYTSPLVTDSAAKLTFAWLGFQTPTNAFSADLFVSITVPANGETHQIAHASLMNIDTPTNLVPDSSLQQVTSGLTWYGSGTPGSNPPALMVLEPYATNVNAFVYTGTGSAATSSIVATSMRTYLPAGSYVASGFIDATNAISGTPEFKVTNDAGTVLASATQVAGAAGVVTHTFTLGVGTMVQYSFTPNGCVVQAGLSLTFAEPQILNSSTNATYTAGPTYGPPNLVMNNERTVTVAAVDVDGDALSDQIEANLSSYLEAQREINFVVNVIGPSYTGIDVSWSGVALPSSDAGVVQIAANAALTAYLSPANWAGGNSVPPYWDSSENSVRFLSVVTLLGETTGMDYLTSVKIGYHGGTLSTNDVPLLGNAPLPTAGTINGTVVND